MGGFGAGSTLLNFNLPGKSAVITLDNVYYTGNMSCSNLPDGVVIWWVNGAWNNIDAKCQAFIAPVDGMTKENPAGETSQTIGVPFTYTLTMPIMATQNGDGTYTWSGQPDTDLITDIKIDDDLTATGADLTYLDNIAYLKSDPGTTFSLPNLGPDNKHLHFEYTPINPLDQLIIELRVVLDSTNAAGTPFQNTATWTLDKWLIAQDGTSTWQDDLPGMDGVSAPMTVVAPDLVVDKSSSTAAMDLDDIADFDIKVTNMGFVDAFDATIEDRIPDGMCDYDLTTSVSARIVDNGGATLRTLSLGTDYSFSYTSCLLSLTMTDAAGGIAPGQSLIISYQTMLNPTSSSIPPIDGMGYTNVAAATQWFNRDSSFSERGQYNRTRTDGTPADDTDHEDSVTVTAGLHGYYFDKTVDNLTSLTNDATTAIPGDTLHYTLHVYNVDQDISTVTIDDLLDPAFFDLTTFGNVVITTGPLYSASWTFNPATGLHIEGSPTLNIDQNGELTVEFDITLRSDLLNGVQVSNQAILYAADAFSVGIPSDDPLSCLPPYTNNVASPDVDGDENPTVVTISIPGPLAKANTQASAAIGEHFTYTITVPEAPIDMPLYDVQITDNLPANLGYVDAQVVSGGSWILSNNGTGNTIVLEDSTGNGIDIPANGQVIIAVTAELLNIPANQSGVTFTNSASYTYNRVKGISSTGMTGGGNTTPNMTVAEPDLSVTKTASYILPATKTLPADPATVGDILEYTVTIPNTGTSKAFDVNFVDTLPANVVLVDGNTDGIPDGAATATIGGSAVAGFIVDPTISGSSVTWGLGNGDGSLDIPAGQSLVLTYQVTVIDASSVSSFTNSVFVNWSSLDGASTAERTGADGIGGLNDYITGPASVTVNTQDNTSITKSVSTDDYAEDPPASPTDPAVLRVGDTVTYDLTLNLNEYTTRSVVVEDVLPVGMEFVSSTINGGPNFSYTAPLAVEPALGDIGTLRWELGDVLNAADGDPSNDSLVIQYVARVVPAPAPTGIDTAPSNLLTNNVKLSYTGGDPAVYPARLTASATIEVRQPQLSPITKVDLGTGRTGTGTQADPYQVDLANDVMQFQLESCNTNGLAPAYGVEFTDVLANELDETNITTPVVAVGGTALNAGSDYTYTYDSASRSMSFVLNTPVNPGECVTVDYSIGFHTNVPADSTWSNTATLNRYWSLPLPPPPDGRLYDSSADQAQVWMTNLVSVEPLSKTLTSAVEATIGETVTYEITVPSVPVNAALDNVVVTDTLHGAFEYVSATAVDSGGSAVTLADSSVLPGDVNLAIAQIPAGEQVIITLTTRVANNAQANAGTSFTNTASYTYTGMTDPTQTEGTSETLTIIEPAVTAIKSVNPATPPTAGDILTYTVNLTAASGADYSSAYDISLVDTLSLGLVYNGNVTVTGAGNTIAAPVINVGGDGISTAQTLTWSVADANADIGIPEGATVTVTYQVRVLDTVVAGQTLTNDVTAAWTSLDGVNSYERDGSGGINDYVATATTSLTTPPDATTLVKTRLTDTYNAGDANLRPGDLVDFELRIGLQEGTHTDLVLTDTLPAGMVYVNMVSADFFGTPGAATPSQSGQTLTWNLGTVVNPGDGDPTNDYLVIVYRARVLNNLTQQNSTPLTNNATLDYTLGGGVPAPQLTAGQTVTVLQPMLAVTKNAAPAGGDMAVDAGEVITYTVDIVNSGAAPAYDTVLTDTLPVGLRQGGITTTSITLVNSGTNLPVQAPTYDSATGVATWDPPGISIPATSMRTPFRRARPCE